MKNKFLVCAFCFCSFSADAAVCVSDKHVEYIEAGNLSAAHGGSNGNNAVIIGYEGGQTISFSYYTNADDHGGKAMLSLLTTALVTQKKITAWGNSGCNYVDRVRLHNN